MSFRESTVACALLGVLACSSDPVEGTAGGDASAGSSTSEGVSTSGAATTLGSTGTAEASVGDASTGTSVQPTGDESGTLDDGTTLASTGSSGDDTVADDASTGSGEPVEHHLQHGDQSACDEPLWCIYNGMIDTPAGGPIEGQECFIGPVDPPYELTAMHYSVASVHTELETFELRVYAWDGDEPTTQLASVELNSLAATPMEHDYTFEPAIQIDSTGFCVGFAATEDGLASAIGMAVDTDSLIEDVSYIRTEGPCDAPTWQEVIGAATTPTGNWCMDATVRTIP